MNQAELQAAIATYCAHLETVCDAFNGQAALRDVGVRLSAENMTSGIQRGQGLSRVSQFASRLDDEGVIHEEQLKTVVDCLANLLNTPHACGHVLGAMQSGKTTTSLALQWAGPAIYLLRGERPYPFYIISNQTNHEDQTNRELQRYVTYYGELEVVRTDGEHREEIDALFAMAPTLTAYRQHVLRSAMSDVYSVNPLDDLVYRRVGGRQVIGEIADLCRRATEQGFRPLMIIDEPQFGASDRIVATEAGSKRHPCLLQQIFERIEQEVGQERSDHWFIGLSATPFELNDLTRVWEVRQYLSDRYTGFNFFNGASIDGSARVHHPATLGLSAFGETLKDPFIRNISMAAYAGSPTMFQRFARKIEYEGDQFEYQRDVETAMRQAIEAVLARHAADAAWPIGLCIRAFNNNDRTELLIDRLSLDPERIEIVRYYDRAANGHSVKRAITERRRPDLPYVVFVTNRARMADAFPPAVRFFWDMAQKANNLNALLQGLLGRACGYDKQSTVVMSDANAGIVQAYSARNGGYVYRTSTASIAVGGYRRGAPTTMIKLLDTMQDPVVQAYFAAINAELVTPHLPPGLERVSPPRASGGRPFRTGPILTAAARLGIFEHIEAMPARQALFPQIPMGFSVVRAGEIVHRAGGVRLGYQLDEDGGCRFTFRWSSRDASAQGGAAGRARGARDTVPHLEPTIYVEKYDPNTLETIAKDDPRQPCAWRAFMITFPLREPVRELVAAEVAYPIETSPYDSWMEPEEREAREAYLRSRRAPASDLTPA